MPHLVPIPYPTSPHPNLSLIVPALVYTAAHTAALSSRLRRVNRTALGAGRSAPAHSDADTRVARVRERQRADSFLRAQSSLVSRGLGSVSLRALTAEYRLPAEGVIAAACADSFAPAGVHSRALSHRPILLPSPPTRVVRM
ncbi:hypothetical protein C8F04DRAFT_1269191 [Mycena alexandri]|uniref:Uncharacterized protein n=1 Tax=Mycena alexandri TaxID=1745969 RepID=A0AAD6WSG1_9AGAR|nr:hypothetical protein C8F04DRAFT_1269191 [Mycena alexandri]